MPKKWNWKRVADIVDPDIPAFKNRSTCEQFVWEERVPPRLERKPYKAKGDEYIVADPFTNYYVLVYKDFRHHPSLSYEEGAKQRRAMNYTGWLHSKAITLVEKGRITPKEAYTLKYKAPKRKYTRRTPKAGAIGAEKRT